MRNDAIEVLGWTLLHFVWQGAVVGGLAAMLLVALRRRSANARYLTAVSALGLMLLLPLVTIVWIERTPPPGEVAPIFNTISMIEIPRTRDDGTLALDEPPIQVERIGIDFENPPPADAVPLIPVSETGQTILEDLAEQRSAFRVESLLKPFIPWAVAAWLIGVGVLSLRLFASWWSVRRLRRRATQPASESWQALLRQLSERLRVTRPVKLVESALVEVPAVIGWLRPIILLPATAMTGLKTEQLEALLAHELAHVRRHDYLVNLLQTIVETLLFYHPAVWWLSHCIRLEREHCCDDLAASACGDRLSYAKALVAMEELRAPKLGLAMSSRGGSLLTRVARLLGQAEQQRRPVGWVPGLMILLLTLTAALGAGLLTPPEKPTEGLPNNTQSIATKSTDTNEETSGPTRRQGQEIRADREQPTTETEVERAKRRALLRQQVQNESHIRSAKSNADVAKAEWEKLLEANRKLPGSISAAEIESVRLEYEFDSLILEQSEDALRRVQRELAGQEKNDDADEPLKTLDRRRRAMKFAVDAMKANYDKVLEANRRVPGTVSEKKVTNARKKWEEAQQKHESFTEHENADAEWGQEQNGLRTRLTLLREEPVVGRLIVKVEVQNVGAKEQSCQWISRVAARYFRIMGPDGKDVEDLTEILHGQIRPTKAKPTLIKSKETIVLLEYFDLAGRFLLSKPGQYQIRFGKAADGELAGKFKNAAGDDIVPIPEPKPLTVQLGEGELPEIQAFALRMRKVIPTGWNVGVAGPDELRREDTAHMGLVFDPPNHGKNGELMVLGFFTEGTAPKKFDDKDVIFNDLGPTKFGRAHLGVTRAAKAAWPNCTEQILAQLPPEDKAGTGKAANKVSPKTDVRTQKPTEDRVRFVGRVRLKTEKPLPDLEKVEVPAGKVLDESLVFSKDGGLANVFVYLRKPTFAIEPTAEAELAKPFVLIVDSGKFWPHAALVRVGRLVVFENGAAENMNFRTMPVRNNPFNVLVKSQDRFKAPAFDRSENTPIPVKNDVKPWMLAHLLTLDHPFAAITGDDGCFTINGLPPGEHELRVWHERVGWLEKSLVITIKPGEDARSDLEYPPDRLKLTEAEVLAWGKRLIDAKWIPRLKVPQPAVPPPQDEKQSEISDLKSQISEAKPDAAKTAIERGVTFLKSQQTDSGLWPERLAPTFDGGVSSLCVLALLQSGTKPDEAVIQKTLVSLRKIKPDKTYTVALQTMVFCAASPKEDAELIRRNVAWIEKAQVTAGASRGGWSYHPNAGGGSDGSNSRFAVMGLHAAKKAGFDVQDETWRRVSDYYVKTQTDQGGWGYSSIANPSPSMTLAGIGSLATANRYLPNDDQTKVREAIMLKPIGYLEKAISTLPNESFTSYTFHCLERAGHISGIKEFGKLDWKADAIKRLLETQQPNGSWNGKGIGETDFISTSFAILVLSGQPEPLLFGYRLRFEPRDPDKKFQMQSNLMQDSVPPRQRTELSGGVRIEFIESDFVKCRIEADRAVIESVASEVHQTIFPLDNSVIRIECIGSVKCEDRRGAESTQLKAERLWFDVRKNYIRIDKASSQP